MTALSFLYFYLHVCFRMKVAGRVILILSLCCLFVSGAFAQGYKKKVDPGYANRWNLGISLGPDFYYGDLTFNTSPNRNLSMAGSLNIGWQISNVFGARLQFLGAWLNGSADSLINGEIVVNPLTGVLLEATMQATVNFTNLFSPYRSARWFFLYGTAGIGYAGWYTEFSNQVYDAGTINTNNPLNNFHAGIVVPLGLGAQFRLGNKFNASIEYTFHLVGSDLLDQTAIGSKSDRFDFLAFGITLNLGKGQQKKTPPVYYQPVPARVVPRTAEPAVPTPRILDPTPPAPSVSLPPPPGMTVPGVEGSSSQNTSFAVQIGAFAAHTYSPQWIRTRYKIPVEVRKEETGKMDRFLVGDCSTLSCAKQLKARMASLGIRDAFIVQYQNGVRIRIVTD